MIYDLLGFHKYKVHIAQKNKLMLVLFPHLYSGDVLMQKDTGVTSVTCRLQLPWYSAHDTQTLSHDLQLNSYVCHSLLANNHMCLFAFAPLTV